MQKSLQALIELQDVDNRLDELLEERGDLPLIVEGLEEKVSAKKQELEKLENDIKTHKERVRELEKNIEEARATLKKYEEQLYQVKTNREYDAITTEIESAQASLKESEAELKKSNLIIEEAMARVTEGEADLKTLEEELKENRAELDERMAETAEEEAGLRGEREKLLKSVKKSVLASYETVRHARDGRGIAPVVDGHCGGCFSAIPPQKVVEVRKMNTVYECEFCGRILVWNEK